MAGCMGGWKMDGLLDGWMHGWIDYGWLEGWMHGWIDDGTMNAWMDERTDARMRMHGHGRMEGWVGWIVGFIKT